MLHDFDEDPPQKNGPVEIVVGLLILFGLFWLLGHAVGPF